MSNPTLSPRRHLVQALTLVNDIINRRKREDLTLSDEENELLQKAYQNAPRTASQNTSNFGTFGGPSNNTTVLNSHAGARSSSTDRSHQQQRKSSTEGDDAAALTSPTNMKNARSIAVVDALIHEGVSDDVSSLVNFAVSCSALTAAPVQLMQLLVDFVIKFVPPGKPVSMMIFDGEYTVDPINGTLLANSDRFTKMFADSTSDFVFDAVAAAYFLPVSAEGELFGFVQINNMHAEGELQADRCKILIASTSISALALRTSWQLEDMEWTHRKQVTLLKVSQTLTSDAFSKEHEVVNRIISKSKDLADAHGSYYFKVENTAESMMTQSGSGGGGGAGGGSSSSGAGGSSASGPDKELKYFSRNGELLSEGEVFSRTSPSRDGDDSLSDDDDDSQKSGVISDAVRLAMQTAEEVMKAGRVIMLQQSVADDNTYVDSVANRAHPRGGRVKAMEIPSGPASSSGAGGSSSLSMTRRGRSKSTAAGASKHDLPFSLVKTKSVCSILGVPILDEDNQVKAVVVLTNKNHRRVARIDVPQVFEQRDAEMMLALTGLAAIALSNTRAASRLKDEKKRRDAILSVVAHLNECDIRNVEEVCKYVMHGAKKLLNADRSTLFLIDEEHDELYSAVADSVGKVIRFPVGKGIAGRVALTGQGESIRDAYQDDRFNKEVDKETGYRTLSILTVPVMSKGNNLGVAQLINKLDHKGNPTPFSYDDMEMLRNFCMFAGIAISNSQLLEFTLKAGQEAMMLTNFDTERVELGQVGMPTLNRQLTSSSMQISGDLSPIPPSELEFCKKALDKIKLLKEKDPRFDPTGIDFDLFALREEAEDGAQARDFGSAVVVHLFQCAGFDRIYKIDEDTLMSFVLQCRKMYRFVPYHNFFHAVDVTQTIYTFLFCAGAREFVSELECFVLLITALVHDLDHMGTNNNYHMKTDSPLGILSAVSGNNSVLEVHHCNVAIQILSSRDAAIFASLPRADQSAGYRLMMSCVLATDMARHGELLNQFESICGTAGSAFNKNDDAHRLLALQMLIKAADVSNVSKPFPISRQWAVAVTEEFYQQGDKERAKGLAVLPMNDRQLGTELAKGQIGFINFVAMKFFTSLQNHLFKGMSWAVERVKTNKNNWQEMLDSHPDKKE